MEEDLYKIRMHLPIDDEEIENYFSKLSNTLNLNYKNNEFQFAYIALHLLFMTYLYNLVWQISKINVDYYKIASLFVRPFNGSEIDLNNIKSIFEFKDLPEKDVINFLHLIGLDNSYIGILKKQIEKRNSMAHASGIYELIDINSFEPEKDTVISIIEKCTSMFCNKLLNKFYIKSIEKWLNDDKVDHSDYEFFIDEYLIIDISASQIQLSNLANLSRNQFYKIMKENITDTKIYSNIFKKHLEIIENIKDKYLIS